MSTVAAIVVDIDDTLLDSSGRAPAKTLEALRACAQKGIGVYVATARTEQMVFRDGEVDDGAFLKRRGVYASGAVARDEDLGVVLEWTLPADLSGAVARRMVEIDPDMQIVVQRHRQYHAFHHPLDEALLEHWGLGPDDLIAFDDALSRESSRVVGIEGRVPLPDVNDELCRTFPGVLGSVVARAGWMQITAPEATKAQALAALLAKRGIDPATVAAFGDDTTDIGMLAMVGHSFAMGNARDDVKAAAKHVTATNDEDGIAVALQDMLGVV
jgi:Cof subfamily protein (haloacid dehalogenase superfamily)